MESRSRQRSIARCTTVAAIAMLCVVTADVEGFAQDAQTVPVPTLRAVRVDAGASGGSTTVILEADGPLPAPLSGALDGPPRIYLDLNGVRPATAVRLAEPNALVLRARVGLHGANPISTRVVLDLSRPTPYRIDSSGRAQGRLTIVLGVPSSASAPAPPPVRTQTRTSIPPRVTPSPSAAIPSATAPAPPASAQPAPAAPAPSPSVSRSPAAPQRRATVGDVYVIQISVPIGRLLALRPVLVSIDRRAEQPAGDLRAAIAEFDAVGRMLAAIKPPASRETNHGLLVRACALGARASRMRMESAPTDDLVSGWNAASAAAGALIMLDSASTELGYSPPK
jgi:hypothetical protein